VPRKNIDHDAVREALGADGWEITHDPFPLAYGRDMYVDLGAVGTLAAEKGGRQIAVEIQSFLGLSFVRTLQEAVGQFAVYREVMAVTFPDHKLYMAISREVHDEIFDDKLGRFIFERLRVPVVVYDADQKRVVKWIE
jgi:XisH protein